MGSRSKKQKLLIILLEIILLVAIGMTNSFAGDTYLTWEEMDFLSGKRDLSLAAAQNSFLYATGGYLSTGSSNYVDNSLWIYDISEQEGRPGTPMNQARRKHCSVFMDGYLYVMGGEIGKDETLTVLDSVERYNPLTDSWEILPSLKVKRSGAGASVYNGKIYIFGGWDGANALASFEIYDPQTNQWGFGAPLPKALDRVCAVTVDTSIWLLGKNGFDKYVYEYRPSAGTWHKFRYHFDVNDYWEEFSGIATLGTTILIVSSFPHLFEGTAVNKCWLFDTTTHALQTTSALPALNGIYGVASAGGAFYSVASSSWNAFYPPVEGSAATLSFVRSPSNGRPGKTFAQQPVIEVLDTNGNRAKSASGQIAVAIKTGTGSDSAHLTGTTTVPIADGLGHFSNLAIDKLGSGYQLVAESSGLAPAPSLPFAIREIEKGVPVRLSNARHPTEDTWPIKENYPAVATDGNAYLIVWYRTYVIAESLMRSDTFFSRVLPDGTVMEPSGIELKGEGDLSSVCWADDTYWIVNNKWRIHDERILGFRVTSNGEMLDHRPFKLGSAGHDSAATILPPSIAFNGDRLLVVWEKVDPQGIYGTLFSQDGELIKESFLIAATDVSSGTIIPRVLALGSSFLVVGDGGLAARVSEDGEVFDVPPKDLAADWKVYKGFACSHGSNHWFCAYLNDSRDAFHGIQVSASGVVTPVGEILGNIPPMAGVWTGQSDDSDVYRRFHLAWDGYNYHLFWTTYLDAGENHDVRMAAFTQDLSKVTDAPLSDDMVVDGLAAASINATNTLLVYTDEGGEYDRFIFDDVDGSHIKYCTITPSTKEEDFPWEMFLPAIIRKK